MTTAIRRLFAVPVLAAALALSAGCEKGPAEKVGANVDKAGSKVKDAVTPDGPAERAGEKLDKAVR